MVDLNQEFSLLYQSFQDSVSSERTNLAGPLVLGALSAWSFVDKLNKLNYIKIRVVKGDVDRSKIFLEREAFVPGFKFTGIITSLVDIDDNTLEITIHEKAWHFTRRLYKIEDEFKEYTLELEPAQDFSRFVDEIIASANADMPFDWKLGEGIVVAIEGLLMRYDFDSDFVDKTGITRAKISNGVPVYSPAPLKHGLHGMVIGADGPTISIDKHSNVNNVFYDNGSITFNIMISSNNSMERDIFSKIADSGFEYRLSIGNVSDGTCRLRFRQKTGTSNLYWRTAKDIPLNTPLLITLNYHSFSNLNNPTLFINGMIRNHDNGLFPSVGVRSTQAVRQDLSGALHIGTTLGPSNTNNSGFDGVISGFRIYSRQLTITEHRVMLKSSYAFNTDWRLDEIPAVSALNFDVKWKSYYEVLKRVAVATANDLWFEENKVWIGVKGKTVELDRNDKIYEKLSTKIDLETFGNIVNVVGGKDGNENVHAMKMKPKEDLLYNYERVISNNNFKTQDSVDNAVGLVLDDANSIRPDVKLNVSVDVVNKYNLQSGDIIKINSNSETQTVKGFYRIINITVSNLNSTIKLQFSKTGKFLPRISDSLDIFEATILKLQDLELNS